MNAVIYARFSSDKQTELSIEAQVRACREYAARHDMTITAVYADEAISGRTANRAQYQKMLSDASKKLFSAVLIHKYDRIARNLEEHVKLSARLNKCDIDLIAVAQDFGNSAESKIMRALIWSMSEYYSDNLSLEVQKGHKEIALKAMHNGGYAPFGYDVVNQRYVINELEAHYVRRLFAAVQDGSGTRPIMSEMKKAGIKGKRGKEIKYPQVYEMLRNEKYTGTYLYCPKEIKNRQDRREKNSEDVIRIENAFPAIIEKEQFNEVQKIMNERKNNGCGDHYLCSGLVYCACGSKMHVYKSTRKAHTYTRYVCSAHCGRHTVHVEDVDDAARKYLNTLLSDANITLITAAMRKYQSEDYNRLEAFYGVMNAKIKEKRHEYDNLMQNMTSATLPPDIVADMAAKMSELKAEIETLKSTKPPEDYTVDFIQQWLNSLKNSADEKAIRLLIERIDVDNNKKSNTLFNFQSTLNKVLENMIAGVRYIDFQHYFPEILFTYKT